MYFTSWCNIINVIRETNKVFVEITVHSKSFVNSVKRKKLNQMRNHCGKYLKK